MPWRPYIILACLALLALALLGGGGGSAADLVVLRGLSNDLASQPRLTTMVIGVTQLGGAPFLLGLTAFTAAALAVYRRRPEALMLVLVSAGGRLAVELIKSVVERPRPELFHWPVPVSSFSFPSGHAANSMITFLALALTVRDPARRRVAIAAACAASLIVGLTRPMLGVHYPSDVVAGWAFGVAWIASWSTLISRRAGTTA